MVCSCKMFTDKRISHRRAASKAGREAGPKSDIIKLLEERGIRWFRLQSGDIVGRAGGKGKAWKVKGCKSGTPDLLCLVFMNEKFYSIPLWIEIKNSHGEQSPEQVEFQRQAEDFHERYLLARSAEDVSKWLQENL